MHTSRRQTLQTLLLAPLGALFLRSRGQAQEPPEPDPVPMREEGTSQVAGRFLMQIPKDARILHSQCDGKYLTVWYLEDRYGGMQYVMESTISL